MLILTESTDKIQVLIDTAVSTVDCSVSYRDSSSTTYTPSRNGVIISSTSAADLVTGPSSGTSRVIDYISILNLSSTACFVTVRAVYSSSNYILWKGLLNSREKVEYTDSLGFTVKNSLLTISDVLADYKTSGLVPVVQGDSYTSVLKRDYVANSDTQFQINRGLGFPVEANKLYFFEFFIRYETGTAATGTSHTITGPATTFLMYDSNYSLAATTMTINPNLVAYGGGAVNTDTANTPNARANIRGLCLPSQAGYIFSEVSTETNLAGSVTIKAGSFVEWKQVYSA